MNTGKRNTARKVLCLVLAVLILGSLVSGALIMTVGAASSKEIEKELVALREEQAELKKQSDALQTSINENQAKTQTLVEKKADIDQQMEMSRQTIENLNEQIQQYSLLIAQKQDELEQTEAEEARLNKQYKTRLRAMTASTLRSPSKGTRCPSMTIIPFAMAHSSSMASIAPKGHAPQQAPQWMHFSLSMT